MWPITTLTSATQKKSAEFAVELCEIVAAGNKIDCTDEERITLFIKYFKSYPGIFETISRHLNKTIFSLLTPIQSVQLQSLLRITTFKFRLLRGFFSNLNIKLFSSEGKMRKVTRELLSYVKLILNVEPKNYIHITVLRILRHVLTLGLKTS